MTKKEKFEFTHVPLEKLIADNSLQVRKDINQFHVSTLKEVLRSGKEFNDPLVVLPDYRIICGFNRHLAYRKVCSADRQIPVYIYHAESDLDAYLYAVQDNISHGHPLGTIDKNLIRDNLKSHGYYDDKISEILGVSVNRFKQWDAERVEVFKPDTKDKTSSMPRKRNVKIPKQMNEVQYERHIKSHSNYTTFHAKKIIERIKDGTIEDDEKTWQILDELAFLIQNNGNNKEDLKNGTNG